MKDELPRIYWAKRISRAKIWRLYQRDALGIADEDLIDEVGTALYARCQSIIMVTEANRVICPQCQNLIVCPEARWSKTWSIVCSACEWRAS